MHFPKFAKKCTVSLHFTNWNRTIFVFSSNFISSNSLKIIEHFESPWVFRMLKTYINHRENAGTLGMVPLIINPIYTLYSGYLLGPISPFKGLLGGCSTSIFPMNKQLHRFPPPVDQLLVVVLPSNARFRHQRWRQQVWWHQQWWNLPQWPKCCLLKVDTFFMDAILL